MNEFDFLTGALPDAPSGMVGQSTSIEQQLELAKALKRKSNLGMLAQLTGDKVLAPFGQAQSKQADQYAEQRELSRQKNVDDARSTKYQDAQINQMEGVLAESMRAAKARDATDRRGQDLAANSVLVKTLNQPERAKPRLTEGDKKRLETLSGENSALFRLQDFFSKGGKMGAVEAGGLPLPGVRTLSNTAASFGYGSKGMKETFAAKQDFDNFYVLAARKNLFGATLTPSEQKAFADANPSTRQSDAQIEGAIGSMRKIIAAKLKNTAEGLIAEGYNPTAIKAYGFDVDAEQSGGATAKWEEEELPKDLKGLKALEAKALKDLGMAP